MKKNFFLLLILTFINGIDVFSQAYNVDEIYRIIQNKLNFDKNYLNIYSVTVQFKDKDIESLKNFPRTEDKPIFNFQTKENVYYNVVFLKEFLELDSLVVLYINQIEDKSASGETFFGSVTGSSIDTSTALSFRDIQEAYFTNRDLYNSLYAFVMQVTRTEEPVSLLGIKVDDKINKSRGISSQDNRDYLNFAYVNNFHRYPKYQHEKTKTTSRRTKTITEETGDSYLIDATFSKVSFYHDAMNFGTSSISAELGFGTDVLNLLPWQSMSLSGGIRTLISISGETANINDAYVLDVRLLGRMRLNTSSFIESMPYIFINKPKLNVGSGFIADIHTTRAFGLPFMNLYFSTGSEDIENPFVKIGRPDSSFAYFTSRQWETTFSFFWNTSEEMNIRFRMDLGLGNYNVIKARYYKGTSRELAFNKILPVVSLYLNFIPKNNDFLGTYLRIYDNQLTFNFWLKIFEIGTEHKFRFESTFISAPFLRAVRPWESSDASTLVQIRYRYGF